MTMTFAGAIGIFLAGVLTLAIFSFLYKDNPVYKFAEHLFVGTSAGYWFIYNVYNIFVPNVLVAWREAGGEPTSEWARAYRRRARRRSSTSAISNQPSAIHEEAAA